MPAIDTNTIKEIRDATGASIMMIKRALTEAEGDKVQALEVLRRLGHDAAAKKEGRETMAGRIAAYVHAGDKVGVLIELRSETDFVSRNDEFGALGRNVAMHVAAMKPLTVEELMLQPYVRDEKQTIGDLVKKASAAFGERIEIKQFVRYEL